MPNHQIIRTVEVKLYPSVAQEATLVSWLRSCCWVYNRALEHRIKAYRRRGKSPSRYDQQVMLTGWRARMESLRQVPLWFLRAALFRLDRAMQAFFRRHKAGEKPGFPRFRSHRRYSSLECLCPSNYLGIGSVRIPKLGEVRARGRLDVPGKQKLLRVIRRASGWYAQVVVDQGECPPVGRIESPIGIDVGLNSFAALSTGETIDNPRLLRRSEARLKRYQRRVSRRVKGSRNRRKAVHRLARQHERVASRRRDFAHQQARKIVDRFDLIAVENLNIKGLARGRLAKSVNDAAWGLFLFYLTYKAAYAGKFVVAVDPRGTSRECPGCGAVRAKNLSERHHLCSCGAFLDRDHASALVMLARALRGSGGVTPAEGSANTGVARRSRAGPLKQEVRRHARHG